MRKGKLTNSELIKLLSFTSKRNEEVLVSSGIGEDCACIKSDKLIAVTTDPITAKCYNIGYLAINVSANDIASSGGVPFAALVTIIATPDEDIKHIENIMKDIDSAAKDINVDIIGGHTEFSDCVNRTIVSVTMLGKCDRFISGSKPLIGDSIIVTRDIGIEGTGILIDNHKSELLKQLSVEELERAKSFSSDISVLNVGLIVSGLDNITSMHDITEGGVFGAIAEMCYSRGVGAEIIVDKIPLYDLTAKITEILGISPYRMLSSGSMLITSSTPNKVIEALKGSQIKATIIGKITKENVIAVYKNRKEQIFTEADEIFTRG